MTLLTDNINIGPGQPVDSEHILRSLRALSGETINDITIRGSLTNIGNFINIGSASISDNLDITNGHLFVGNKFVIKRNGDISGQDAKFKNIITKDLTISGSLMIKDIPNQETTTFISVDLNTGLLGYASGSLKQPEDGKWFERNFIFNPNNDLECTSTFKDKIYNLSVINSDEIRSIKLFSKINKATLNWTEHKDIASLEDWIHNKSGDSLYWIKLLAEYKTFSSGKSESILVYSKIK